MLPDQTHTDDGKEQFPVNERYQRCTGHRPDNWGEQNNRGQGSHDPDGILFIKRPCIGYITNGGDEADTGSPYKTGTVPFDRGDKQHVS